MIGSEFMRTHPTTMHSYCTHTLTLSHREPNMAEAEGSEITSGGIFQEIFTSPLNLTLLSLCLFLLYKIFRGDKQPELGEVEKPLPKLKKRDFTLADLKPYDGLENPRILMAVNGKVFDVTRGKKFYGPGNVTRERAVTTNVTSPTAAGTKRPLLCCETSLNHGSSLTLISNISSFCFLGVFLA